MAYHSNNVCLCDESENDLRDTIKELIAAHLANDPSAIYTADDALSEAIIEFGNSIHDHVKRNHKRENN